MSLFDNIRRFFSPTRKEILDESGLPDYFEGDTTKPVEPDVPHEAPAAAVPLRYKCWRCKTVYRRLKAKRRKFKCQCGIQLYPLTGELTQCAECNLEFPFEVLGSCPRCDFRAEEARPRLPILPGQFVNDLAAKPDLTNEELWKQWQ